MHIETILETVRKHRPYSTNTFYRDALKLGIVPIIRQKPQNWPEDTAERILAHRGFLNGSVAEHGNAGAGSALARKAGVKTRFPVTVRALPPSNGKLVSVPQLRKARKKARGK